MLRELEEIMLLSKWDEVETFLAERCKRFGIDRIVVFGPTTTVVLALVDLYHGREDVTEELCGGHSRGCGTESLVGPLIGSS